MGFGLPTIHSYGSSAGVAPLKRLAYLWLFTLLTGTALPSLRAQTPPDKGESLSIYYHLQSTEPGQGNRSKLHDFLTTRHRKGQTLLLQGFGCDLGGRVVSRRVAKVRRDTMVRLLREEEGIDPSSILTAPSRVLPGEPRQLHRKVIVTLFESRREAEEALRETKERNGGSEGMSVEESPEQTSLSPRKWGGVTFFGIILLLALILALVLLYLAGRDLLRRRRLKRHTITPGQRLALEELTDMVGEEIFRGEPTLPIPPSLMPSEESDQKARESDAPSGGQSRKGTSGKTGDKSMATKKKTQTNTGSFTLKGVIDRLFADKSLKELKSSPIHALEGLTPRHTRLLEEGFGVKTIEDLAGLKYFEIARAIVVLSRYEK